MYNIRHAGAKGLGVFASKQIPRGTRVLAERPFLAVKSERDVFSSTQSLSTADKEFLLQLSVATDRPASTLQWIESAWLVATSGSLPRTVTVSEHTALLAAFRNNNFDIGDGVQAVFRDICRINHSCIPNSQGSFNHGLKRFTIHAVRSIDADEEVTISYLDEHGAIRQSRQDRLLKGYGFECNCAACKSGTDMSESSEQRRTQMRDKLKLHIEKASMQQEPDRKKDLHIMRDLIEMFEEEGLVGRELATMYLSAAEVCTQIGEHREARQQARRGLEMEEICLGTDNPLFLESRRRMKPIVGG